jgi:hypothetical protein
MDDLEQGMPVTVDDDGKDVNGYVDSITLNPAKKINVRIIHPGHKQHGLTVAFDPEKVTPGESVPDEDESGITKEDLDGFAQHVSQTVDGFNERVTALETLPSAVSALQARVDALEANAAKSAELQPKEQEQAANE